MEKSFVEQVRELNKKYGRNLSFEDLKKLKETGELKTEYTEMDSLDGIVFVHITDWEPTDNRIKTAKGKKVVQEVEGVEVEKARDTTHFTINSIVETHDSSNWDKRKYAIIIPARTYIKNNGSKMIGTYVEDTYIAGEANIEDAIIICPQDESEKIQKDNPNAITIPFLGKNAIDKDNKINIAKELLGNLMEVRVVPIDPHGYKLSKIVMKIGDYYESIGSAELASQTVKIINDAIMQEYGIEINEAKHSESLPNMEEKIQQSAQIMEKKLKKIPGEEMQNNSTEKIYKDYKLGYISGYGLYFLQELQQKYTKYNFNHYSENRIKESVEMVNSRLIPIGLSVLDAVKKDNVEFRCIESKKIDNYLNRDITEIYDGDIITTNLQRMKLISDKMKQDGTLDDKKTQEILEFAVKHFMSDLSALSKWHGSRIDMQDFDYEEYMRNLKLRFRELGIRGDELLDEVVENKGDTLIVSKTVDRILDEKRIQEFIENQGYSEEPEKDFIERDIDRVMIGENILRRNIAQNIREGKSENDIFLEDGVEKANNLLDAAVASFKHEIATREDEDNISMILQQRGVSQKTILDASTDKRFDEIWDEAVELTKTDKEITNVVEPLPDVKQVLIDTYEQAQIENADTHTAHNMLKKESQKNKEGDLIQNFGGEEYDE